nr:RNA-directed DNA polymerase, eukaryota, reverse transcriptase zinc-binding domain protein [Tanacetum cinerariifolium]
MVDMPAPREVVIYFIDGTTAILVGHLHVYSVTIISHTITNLVLAPSTAIASITTRDALWCRVVRSIHGGDGGMGNGEGARLVSSGVWGDIIKVREGCAKKINVFVWRGLRGRLPVLIELDKKGVDIPNILCPMCDETMETMDHALVLCNESMRVWSKFFEWWGYGFLDSFITSDMLRHEGGNFVSSNSKVLWEAVVWITSVGRSACASAKHRYAICEKNLKEERRLIETKGCSLFAGFILISTISSTVPFVKCRRAVVAIPGLGEEKN